MSQLGKNTDDLIKHQQLFIKLLLYRRLCVGVKGNCSCHGKISEFPNILELYSLPQESLNDLL